MGNKTVYPVPGVHLRDIESEKQTVDEAWAAELVASGAFRYTDISDETKQSLIDQEVKRVMDAQQSDPVINEAKLTAKLAKGDKLPDEAISGTTPTPATAGEPRAIAGVDSDSIKAAIDKGIPDDASKAKTPRGDDQTGGLQVTK